MDTIRISLFKATCLEVLDRVCRTGQPIRVTRRGRPIADILPPGPSPAPAEWLGSLRDTGRIVGDVLTPAVETESWEATRS